ncbi:MAG: hypothetical protein JXA58_03410 [Dehalococcoidia bacterium]|nr:hypothetical protein [Dehalococcoidia bacterium]
MPFKTRTFQENVERWVGGATRDELLSACQAYATLTTAQQQTQAIHRMMDTLDQNVDEAARRAIMQACGRTCTSASLLQRVRKLRQETPDLDDLLCRLNETHIGGGHLRREGDFIYAAYDRCYCGSVNKTRQPFSATYCYCSCGWFEQLFTAIFDRPVEVELVSSIIQGDERCQFRIRWNGD